MKLYKINDKYVCKFTETKQDDSHEEITTTAHLEKDYEFICILDVSWSMGNHAIHMINKIIPNIMRKIGKRKVTLITFATESQLTKMSISQLEKVVKIEQGCTYMAPAIKLLSDHMKPGKSYKIMALSDGVLHDQENTVSKIGKINNDDKTINTQAVRLYTSSFDPDVRGLAGIMNLNNSGKTNMIDVNANNDDQSIIDKISKLYQKTYVLEYKNDIVSKTLWGKPTNKLTLSSGDFIFYSSIPPKTICEILELNGSSIMTGLIDHYVQKVKLLKIIGTESTNVELANIIRLCNILESCCDDNKDMKSITLKDRIKKFRLKVKHRSKSSLYALRQALNDDKVNKLNSLQQANYLRNVHKSVARRSDSDFSVIINELKSLYENRDELKDLEEEKDNVSFISQEGTLEWIRCLDEVLSVAEDLEVHELLQLVNIVGLGCDCVINNYPNAMTLRINGIYKCYVSVCDVTNNVIKVPGQASMTVNSVIPVFSDVRIYKYLKKYAPVLLECNYSVGIRRMIANVPKTMYYTITSAILFLMGQPKSNLNRNITKDLLKVIKKSKLDLTKDYGDLLYDLEGCESHDLIKVLTSDNKPVIRAIYCREYYLYLRKQKINMEKLLNIKYTSLSSLFKKDKYKKNCNYKINHKYLEKFTPKYLQKFMKTNHKYNFYNIVQVIMFGKNRDKLVDVVNEKLAEDMVKEYVNKLYKHNFDQKLRSKQTSENKIMEREFMKKYCEELDISKCGKMLSDGINYKGRTFILEPTHVVKVFDDVKDEDKLFMLVSGKDCKGNKLWNNGNPTVTRKFITKFDNEEYNKFFKGSLHSYRDSANRHGHSNKFPSYWALGYQTLREMRENVCKEDFDNYITNHCQSIGCCKCNSIFLACLAPLAKSKILTNSKS